MKKQNYLCVDMTTYSEQALQVKQPVFGRFEMDEPEEHFIFVEGRKRTCNRNPIVWRGQYFNISTDPNGTYHIHFRQMELDSSIDPLAITDQLFIELERAKADLKV